MKYTDVNASTIDSWNAEGWEWGRAISHETYEKALGGEWDVFLSPTLPVPHEWFGGLCGKKLLGLASGGGQQMPVFTACGADCTVFDISDSQLESERMVAEREHYNIDIVKGDMTEPLPFSDGTFDIIFHPVSNCYIKEVKPVWRECARVLKKGGILMCGLDNGLNMAFNDDGILEHRLPFDPLADEKLAKEMLDINMGYQFSHTIEEQVGGQLEAGLVLTNIFGDTNGYGKLDEYKIETFIVTRAVKQ